MAQNIFWLGHDSFRMTDEKHIIYIDPWKLAPGTEKADVILVTHGHHDHLSKNDIAAISKSNTVIVGPPSVAEQLGPKTVVATAGATLNVAGLDIEVVPAYNLNKKFHPKSAGGVGYVLTLDGKRIYHAGDTDLIPEMEELKVDIALLPVSGTYVMTAEEAASAANLIKPSLAIPMHYGDPEVVGTRQDAEQFKKLAKVPVEILEKSQ